LGYQLSNGTDGETVASPAGAVNGAAIGEVVAHFADRHRNHHTITLSESRSKGSHPPRPFTDIPFASESACKLNEIREPKTLLHL